MSMIGGFFKRTKYQKFEYKPRYWNPDKENLQQRIKAAKGESDNDPEAMKMRIANSLRKNYKNRHKSSHSASSKKSTLMLLVIIVALLFLSYYLLTVYLPLIEERLK